MGQRLPARIDAGDFPDLGLHVGNCVAGLHIGDVHNLVVPPGVWKNSVLMDVDAKPEGGRPCRCRCHCAAAAAAAAAAGRVERREARHGLLLDVGVRQCASVVQLWTPSGC